MPAKYTLLEKTLFNSAADLDLVLCSLLTHAKVTRTQYIELHKLAAMNYPATLEIDQRMPRQALYISINESHYQLNNRAKLKYIREND